MARAAFRPHFTLFILYFGVFFIGFITLLILPELMELLEMPPGEEQQAASYRVAREVAGPRLGPAFALAALSLALGGYYEVLPGIKTRG